jgi:hypothetical protein
LPLAYTRAVKLVHSFSRSLARLAPLLAVAACGSPQPAAVTDLSSQAPALAPAPSADPNAPGAAYLALLEAKFAPPWQQFLTDCRNRLAADNTLNDMRLVTRIALSIDGSGKVVRHDTLTSGNTDFDAVAEAIIEENRQLPVPPAAQRSDDGSVRVEWTFARDKRRATAASAQIVILQAPVNVAVAGLIARGKFGEAASRLRSTTNDPDSARTAETLALTIVKRALHSSDTETARTGLMAAIEDAPSLRVDVIALATATRDDWWPALTLLQAAELWSAEAQRVLARPDELPSMLPTLTSAYASLSWSPTIKALRQRKLGGHALAIEARINPSTAQLPDDATVRASSTATRGMACFAYAAIAVQRKQAWGRINDALQDGSATVRRDCVRALVTPAAAPKTVINSIRQLLLDADEQVAASAVDAAVFQGLAMSGKQKLDLAKHKSAAVRRAVASQTSLLHCKPTRILRFVKRSLRCQHSHRG